MRNHTHMLDTTRTYETPESIELSLNVAGLMPRASAWLIDLLIRMGVFIAFVLVFSVFGGFGQGVLLIVFFLLEWFYPVFFEVRTGTTPGKKRYNLMVCHDNGTPISWQSSITRNLLRTADFLPMLFGFGILSMLFHKDFKRLGDIAAGTIVIYKDSPIRYDTSDVPPIRLPSAVSLSQRQAMLAYAARLDSLSPERQQELAAMLLPYMQSAHTSSRHATSDRGAMHVTNPVTQIQGYANYILQGGQRDSAQTHSKLSRQHTSQEKMQEQTSGISLMHRKQDDIGKDG